MFTVQAQNWWIYENILVNHWLFPKNISIHKKTASVQLNLMLFVFCLHVLFIIHFSINFLSQLHRRLLNYNIMLNFVLVTRYAYLWRTLLLLQSLNGFLVQGCRRLVLSFMGVLILGRYSSSSSSSRYVDSMDSLGSFSCNLSLSVIALSKSSTRHPVSAKSWWV